MPRRRLLSACLVVATMLAAIRPATAEDARAEFFEKRIRPVLADHCYSCHSAQAEKLKAGLRVDSREALLRGGESGPALAPGGPDHSLLIRALAYEDPDLQMPPKTRLPAEVVDDFRRWIREGATWPVSPASAANPGTAGAAGAAKPGFDLAGRRAAHWAWQPVRRPALPAVRDTAWPRDDLDRFVLDRLEGAGLGPAKAADHRTLARRAAFAITGLPPTPDELAQLDRDPSPAGFARLVDQWLASPRYGERWARHWLDKVRYAETLGHEFDYPILGAWRYRDYVVRAFNTDLPYADFVREQIAGDLLPRRDSGAGHDNEALLATVQWWLPQQTHSPVDARAHMSEVIDNQIDVFSKAFLGLTVACARCHDHKFDAVSTRDYYALHGILGSSRYAIRAVGPDFELTPHVAELQTARRALRHQLADRLLARLADPAPLPATNQAAVRFQSGPDDVRLPADGWFPDGPAFTADADPRGEPAWIGGHEVRLIPPGWRHGASLARRFQGALRSPTFTIDREFLHLRLAGRGVRFSVAVEGFPLLRAPIYGSLRQSVQRPDPHWVSIDVTMWKGRRAWIEFTDFAAPDPAWDNPADSRLPDGWIAVGEVVRSPRREPPTAEKSATPAQPREVVGRWREQPNSLSADEVAWLDAALRSLDLPESLFAALAQADAALPEPVLVGGMTEGTGIDETVFIRGNYRTPGPTVPRRFLEALPVPGSTDADFTQGSGRLALARAVTHPDNPFFARVHVNWVWAHLFGRGIAPSVDNFGVLGERPTHPELLDFLADEFQRSGGSTRQLIRRLVLSRAWQMTSRIADVDPEAERRDPDNRLLHRANLGRLEGETLRDAMLAVSGRLVEKVGGPPVPVHLTPFMDGRGRPGSSGPVDGDGRRSLYLEVRRNFLSPLFLAFDAPVPATTVGRRSVSNVPAQALALMNDPFVSGQARLWAERLERQAGGAPGDSIGLAYQLAFARAPQSDEREQAERFVASSGTRAGADRLTGLADLCHALFNAKEFVYVE